MSCDAVALRKCEVNTLMTPASTCTALGRVEPELVGFPGKALEWDATQSLWFIVHAAGLLHSMVLHGRIC